MIHSCNTSLGSDEPKKVVLHYIEDLLMSLVTDFVISICLKGVQ